MNMNCGTIFFQTNPWEWFFKPTQLIKSEQWWWEASTLPWQCGLGMFGGWQPRCWVNVWEFWVSSGPEMAAIHLGGEISTSYCTLQTNIAMDLWKTYVLNQTNVVFHSDVSFLEGLSPVWFLDEDPELPALVYGQTGPAMDVLGDFQPCLLTGRYGNILFLVTPKKIKSNHHHFSGIWLFYSFLDALILCLSNPSWMVSDICGSIGDLEQVIFEP